MAKVKGNKVTLSTTCRLFITITGHPKIYNKVSKDQLSITKPVVHEVLTHMGYEGDMYVELTKENNVHYHGIGTFQVPKRVKHGIRWLKDWWKTNVLARQDTEKYWVLGNINLQNPQNEALVDAYIKKDKTEMMEYLNIPTSQIWRGKNTYNIFIDEDPITDNDDMDIIESEPE